MVLNHSRNIDARGSTINSIGRDQTHTTINFIQISCSLFGSGQTRQPPLHFKEGRSPLPVSQNAIFSEERLISPLHPPLDAGPIIDKSVGLIVQITRLLHDRRDGSNSQRDLVHELKSLHQTLTLTGLAVQEYEGRPLGQSLANTITLEVGRCRVVLQELFDGINGTWLGLNITSIGSLWRPVWWGRWDGDELTSLKRNLFESRRSLEGFLMALHSCVLLSCLFNHTLTYFSFQNHRKGYRGWTWETSYKPAMYLLKGFIIF
jgi:hypothetical protein